MNYTEEQLCEIYYLFHNYDSKCIEDINTKYPELLKYASILRHICFELEIFKYEYTVFFGGEFKTGKLKFSVEKQDGDVFWVSIPERR